MQDLYVEDAMYIITGGLGGIGLSIAASMAEKGARNICLMSRRPPTTPKTLSVIAKLKQMGVKVHVVLGDISKPADAQKPFDIAEVEGIPVRGVWHFAVSIADDFLIKMSDEQFRHVYPSKVDGAWNMHLLTQGTNNFHTKYMGLIVLQNVHPNWISL